MRSSIFIIFFSVVLLIYSSVNYYLYVRGLQIFSLNPTMQCWYRGIFVFVVSSFILGIVLERTASSVFSEWIFRIGSFWLAFMLYLVIAAVLVDAVRFVNHFTHFLPSVSSIRQFQFGILVIALVSLIIIAGHINALWINVKEIPLTIHKKVSGPSEMKILMASDLHLGALIGERREKRLLEIVREQKPDLVLLCGDLVDGEIAPVLRKNLGRHIQEIEAPMGVFAISGNHEYIGGIDKTLPYLKSINIRMLLDEIVVLPNGIHLVGRNDHSAGTRIGEEPKPLDELLSGTDRRNPIIVMNHQPFNLHEATFSKVDLYLAGHTHNGQLWPLNYVTGAIFELSWGFMKKGNTNFYVSSGFGTWGPSVRTGNRPEVVVFNVKFD